MISVLLSSHTLWSLPKPLIRLVSDSLSYDGEKVYKGENKGRGDSVEPTQKMKGGFPTGAIRETEETGKQNITKAKGGQDF